MNSIQQYFPWDLEGQILVLKSHDHKKILQPKITLKMESAYLDGSNIPNFTEYAIQSMGQSAQRDQ